MAFLEVTSGQLRKRAQELAELNSRLMREIEALKEGELRLNNMWEGQANAQFHTAFLRNEGQMKEFYRAILQYANALFVIAARYEEAEAHNMQTAGKKHY